MEILVEDEKLSIKLVHEVERKKMGAGGLIYLILSIYIFSLVFPVSVTMIFLFIATMFF